jgi:tyrosyl-tRNA synthetase
MTVSFKSEFLQTLASRGFIHQITHAEDLDARLTKGIVTAYCGFDCTAQSLHIGNLVSIMMLYWLQQCGHRPIVLIGGGTTKVGDPSGKDEGRKLLDNADIEANITSIRPVFDHLLRFGTGPQDAVLVNNAQWLDGLAYIPFLREIGRHFSVNRMLSMDSVRLRLEREQNLSFLEFNYMILQGYDFLELHRRYGCSLQFGGSDQWGNIVQGVELGRRIDGVDLYGLTTPLITTAAGEKMGKTARGAVWLNEAQLSSYEYWQFWRNTADADVGRFLRLFTTLPLEEIHKLEALQGAELNEAKKLLATHATAFVRGQAGAQTAAQTAQATFEAGSIAENLPNIPYREGLGLLEALMQLDFASSKNTARRLIEQGAVKLNDQPVHEVTLVLEAHQFEAGRLKISAGKKRHGLVVLP